MSNKVIVHSIVVLRFPLVWNVCCASLLIAYVSRISYIHCGHGWQANPQLLIFIFFQVVAQREAADSLARACHFNVATATAKHHPLARTRLRSPPIGQFSHTHADDGCTTSHDCCAWPPLCEGIGRR